MEVGTKEQNLQMEAVQWNIVFFLLKGHESDMKKTVCVEHRIKKRVVIEHSETVMHVSGAANQEIEV